jgi:hypothetical protein
MGYDNQPSGQQAQSDQPLFPVVETVVLERDTRSGKQQSGILEAEAVLGEVLPVFGFVPLVLHFRM